MTSHILVIAEKPSVAQTIAAVLGAKEKKDGFLTGSGYIVSWCVGPVSYTHLDVYKRQTHTEAGEGLIFYGNVVLPFVDHFPKDTELYRIMTTKPEEVSSL